MSTRARVRWTVNGCLSSIQTFMPCRRARDPDGRQLVLEKMPELLPGVLELGGAAAEPTADHLLELLGGLDRLIELEQHGAPGCNG